VPSVFFSAKHLAKKNTRQRSSLPSVFLALGKEASLPTVFLHSAFFAECASLPSVFFTLGKENFRAHFEAVN
jgi:hypothetical protein